jgi:hypothetical protein
MSRAKEQNDLMMLKTLNKPDFLTSTVYHSGCIRRFLLHSTPLKVEFKETESSNHCALLHGSLSYLGALTIQSCVV